MPRAFWHKASKEEILPVEMIVNFQDYLNKSLVGVENTSFFIEFDEYIQESLDEIKENILKNRKHNLILFFPFYVLDFEDLISSILDRSPFMSLIDETIKNCKDQNEIYVLYFSFDKKAVIVDIRNSYRKEYIDFDHSHLLQFVFLNE